MAQVYEAQGQKSIQELRCPEARNWDTAEQWQPEFKQEGGVTKENHKRAGQTKGEEGK